MPDAIDDIIKRQGWTDDTVLTLLWQWFEDTGRVVELAHYLRQKASEENEQSIDPCKCPFCGGQDLIIEVREWDADPSDVEANPDSYAERMREHQCRTCTKSFWT